MAPLPAPGRIIYFSNRGGRSRECPAFARSASRAEKRGGARSGWAAGPRAQGRQRDASRVTQVAAGRGEATAQRYGAPGLGLALGPAGGRRPRGPHPALFPRLHLPLCSGVSVRESALCDSVPCPGRLPSLHLSMSLSESPTPALLSASVSSGSLAVPLGLVLSPPCVSLIPLWPPVLSPALSPCLWVLSWPFCDCPPCSTFLPLHQPCPW